MESVYQKRHNEVFLRLPLNNDLFNVYQIETVVFSLENAPFYFAPVSRSAEL